jgi:2-polyprenyl-3-methyl-5-hydroxy-6-metoxy-1,4-benzoquinol methylase
MPDRIHYRLLQCSRCGLIFSSPILSEKTIANLYKASNVTYDHEIDSLKDTYGRYLQKTLQYVRKNPRLLEIGAGNGFFLEKAIDMGITSVTGIEPGKQSVQQARPDIKKHLITDFFPSKKVKPGTQDIICVFQRIY